MRTPSKIQGNKITSYFKSSSQPLNMKSSSDMDVKNKENNNVTNVKQFISEKKCKDEADSDSDCYIINEEPQNSISLHVENTETPKPFIVSVSQIEGKVIEENGPVVENDDVIPDDNADDLLIEASQHENDYADKPDEDAHITLSQQSSTSQNPQYTSNYATKFFVQMVTDFLSQSCLHYLLSENEMNLMQAFMNLHPFELKILFVRLYWLQWKWQKVETIKKFISYDWRSDFVKNLLKNLEAKGFILTGSQMTLDEFLEIASIAELKKLMAKFPKIFSLPSGGPKNKEAIVKSIKDVCNAKNLIFKSFIRKGEVLTVRETIVKKMVLVLSNYIKIHESAKRTFDLLHSLMYLGTNPQLLRDKKLNLMLLNVQNGQQFYPAMELECDLPSCVYPSRSHFFEYYQAYSLAEIMLYLTTVKYSSIGSTRTQILDTCRKCLHAFKDISQKSDFVEWKPPPWLHRFTPGYQYVRAMELSIKALKTFNSEEIDLETLDVLQTLLDQTTYRQHKRAFWYSEQTSILQMRQRDFTRAAEVLILALNEPSMNEDEKAPLRERAKKLTLQKVVKIDTHVVTLLKGLSKVAHVEIRTVDIIAKGAEGNKSGRKAFYYFDEGESGSRTYVSVEQYALLYYQNNSDFDCGDHWEGRIITSIFNLLFWDIIYSTVKDKGLFLSPYQEVPLDMYTPYFYENRKELIDERLAFIETSSMNDVLEKMKIVLDGRKTGDFSLHSDNLVWEHLSTVSSCLGNAGLHSICKRLAHNYHYAHSGFPDLTIWNSETNQIKFVEVKGEGDKLSFKQTQWIHYLMESNVSAEVCYVHRNDNKYRKKMADKLKINQTAITTNTEVNQNRKKIKAGSKQKNNSRVKISKGPITNDTVDISKDSIARDKVKDPMAIDRVKISRNSLTVTSDTVSNQNRKKIKAGPKQYHDRRVESSKDNAVDILKYPVATDRVEIFKDPITTEKVYNNSIDRIEISKDNLMEISDEPIGLDNRVEISKDSKEKVDISNKPNCKSIKILSPATNQTMMTSFELSNSTNPSPIQTSFLPMNVLDSPVIDLTGLESPTREQNKFISSPAKVAMHARRRLEGLGSPSSSNDSEQEEGVYLRSPSKTSKGVGYFISPPTTPKNLISPTKANYARKKLSLSLTRRRLKDIDK